MLLQFIQIHSCARLSDLYFSTRFSPTAGKTYIVQAGTALPGDQNPANDTILDTLTISAGSETITGEAEICSTSTPMAGLKAN